MGIQNGSGRDRFFLTMELLAGTSLADRIEQGEPLHARRRRCRSPRRSPTGWTPRTRPASSTAISSPATSCCCRRRRAASPQRAVITDFGLALSEEQSDMRLTQSDELVGTPEYMAPEQAEPGPATPATDIYALGLILYEMLSKRRPFETAGTALATVLVRRREPPRPLHEVVPRRAGGVGGRRSTAAWNAIRPAASRAPARSSPPSRTTAAPSPAGIRSRDWILRPARP